MEMPAAKGRYICAGDTLAMRPLIELLAKNGYDKGFKLPKRRMDGALGDLAVRLLSYTQPKGMGSYLRTHVGRVPRYDTTKIRSELGVTFRPVERSILDTLEDLTKWGHLPARA
jgi:dihydroflavonol-4-reductase